jgi:hypothetical protein
LQSPSTVLLNFNHADGDNGEPKSGEDGGEEVESIEAGGEGVVGGVDGGVIASTSGPGESFIESVDWRKHESSLVESTEHVNSCQAFWHMFTPTLPCWTLYGCALTPTLVY